MGSNKYARDEFLETLGRVEGEGKGDGAVGNGFTTTHAKNHHHSGP